MEAAMKSTWEEKAKQSESSERERQRLQRQASETLAYLVHAVANVELFVSILIGNVDRGGWCCVSLARIQP